MGILYKQIATELIDYINTLPSGIDRLPSERELCIRYNVSRQTIRHALDACEEKGIITRRQGSGIYLSEVFKRSVNRIAFILPDSEEYIYPPLISEIKNAFASFSYSVDIYETGENNTNLKNILDYLLKNPVSTIIIAVKKNALPLPFDSLLRQLSQKGSKIIFLGNPYPNLKDYSYIKQDDYFSAYNIASRVIAQSKPWCAFFMHENISSYDKYHGLTSAFNDLDYTYDMTNIKWFSYEDLVKLDKNQSSLILDLIHSLDFVPSIYICDNDLLAYFLIRTLEKEKLYNDELIIYSFDASYIIRLFDNKLISYGTNMPLMVQTIVEMSLSKDKKEKEVITLPSSMHN